MWQVLVSLLSDDDQNIVVDSSLLDLEDADHLYCWKQLMSLDGFDMDLFLSFQLVLNGARLEFMRVRVPKIDIINNAYISVRHGRRRSIYGHISTAFDDTQHIMELEKGVTINYSAFKWSHLSQIHIYTVAVFLERLFLRDLIHCRSNKVSCMANNVYLGRPQQIETHGRVRRHSWAPGEENPFKVSPRSQDFHVFMDETRDLLLMRHENPTEIRTAKEIMNCSGIVWDSDTFSNPVLRLPVRVRDLSLTFYNFKVLPPQRFSCTIKWGDFVVAYLRHLNEIDVLYKSVLAPRQLGKPEKTHEYACGLQVSAGSNFRVFVRYEMLVESQEARITDIKLHGPTEWCF